MSTREKRLLALLLFAGFLVVNFFLFSFYMGKKVQLHTALSSAKARLQQAIAYQESSAQLAGDMEWLAQHEPQPAVYQDVQTQLQQFAENQARNQGLTIRSQELLPTDTTGIHYNRVQITINLTGREESLYRWFDAINEPTAFRSAYQIRLTPNTDDTLIDCSATLAQWFTPAT